jgi:hypothetical protein
MTGFPADWHYRPFQPQSIRCQLVSSIAALTYVGKACEAQMTAQALIPDCVPRR